MTNTAAIGAVSFAVWLVAFIPYFYLIYLVLQKIEGTEFMWLLYWIWIPAAILAQAVSKAYENYRKGVVK